MKKSVSFIQRIKPVDVFRYGLLPGVVPRLREFANNGFGWLAFMMASLYAAVGLLPNNHSYLSSKNIGRYGIRHVITEAASRLVLKKENADQIAMFGVVLLGFILLIMQFAILIVGFVIQPAHAGPFAGFFATRNPQTDIAFQLLDKVFAIPNLYGSSFDPATVGLTPFNEALHDLIHFYNLAILIVAVLIFIYYVLVVVAETANTGTPFGRRFSHIYAPLRLVVAVGLLIPLNYGLNSAQYITLFAAKFGSSLATNTWILFNQTITASVVDANPLGARKETLIARPQMPDVAELVQFMSIVKTCAVGFESAYQKTPYATRNVTLDNIDIQPYLVWGTAGSAAAGVTGYAAATGPAMFDHRDITIRFGHKDQAIFSDQRGYVYPFCGEITIHVDDTTQVGAQIMQEGYYNLVLRLWGDAALYHFAQRESAIHIPNDPNWNQSQNVNVEDDTGGNGKDPVDAFKQARVRDYTQIINTIVQNARDQMVANTNFAIPAELINRGWGGAAIWYNRIAMWNGALLGSVHNTPTAAKMPEPMEICEKQNRMSNQQVDAKKRYECYLSKDRPVEMAEYDRDIATMLNAVYEYWRTDNSTARPDQRISGNVFMDMMNALFPFNALFQIRYNVDVHPLAQLVGLGKSIIDSAMSNLATGLAFGALGGMTSIMGSAMGSPLNAFSNMFIAMTTIGLSIGFVLYYVLPFLPFMYFFFAIGSWVKTIFEAMVGVPLWALAHLRIDGNGLPGEMAMGGYFLIFEIFLRPVLILFGLLGGLVIFSASVRVLHDVFPLLTANVSGFDASLLNLGPDPTATYKGSILDEFFYSLVYTILVYVMALSSFKLIDQIPAHAMRWLGSGARAFNDQRGDTAGDLITYAAIGGNQVSGQVVGGLQGASMGAGQLTGGFLNSITGRNTVNVVGTKNPVASGMLKLPKK